LSLKKILSPEKITLYLLILMLFLIVIFAGRQLVALGERRETLRLEKEALAADHTQLLFLERLAAESPRLRQHLELSQGLIPQRTSAHELFVYLHEMAYFSGMQQIQVDFAEEVPHPEYVEIPLSLSLTGTYQDLLRLLRTLREGERAFRLDNLQITAAEDQTLLEVELTLSAFYRS
jgi:Tfp pilus assembly protein PilO